ncbi:hypothetical protein SDRG_03272 [Saprolegnia diclina VS20]|uniref:T6SS Phospholipase effector Tle1-like catalytic domain-containing protein n=1 Tax=Saprolegnia diclina (strain VS20) TaxID=1156394 RepID=T0QLY2_SAPDV|nr:hypothetical protein SDRG_03272 [Saprolegnia diclina VS20]EQC39064.1 hypothetical protein SDRG_03272 [Saprolegnia diclina VS20]|eukprot:XP_008607125.1 hypothetical protein SDRG_03272 [Saprolegnia diclina VS20]
MSMRLATSPRKAAAVKPIQKRIGIFLDGTWNQKQTQTNVWRLYMQMADGTFGHVHQIRKYFVGVGNKFGHWITGGAFAVGMTDIIRNAYMWLVEHYNDGDEIFLFGFSRGGYEVRALLGMLGSVGLMKPNSPMHIDQLWQRYERTLDTHDVEALSLHQLKKLADVTNLDAESKWMLQYCKEVNIKFVGVFDVVAADWGKVQKDGQNGQLIEHMCHALAIDEHRSSFRASVWEDLDDDDNNDGRRAIDAGYDWLEQRWFVGAHSNVGGGITNDELSHLPLKWIRDRAHDYGLDFRRDSDIELDGEEVVRHAAQIDPSMTLMYQIMQLGQRFFRPIGSSKTLNETIDPSVLQRLQDPTMEYAPKNLLDWAEGLKIDLMAMSPALLSVKSGEVLKVADDTKTPAATSS